ncbi:major facilitator superfamily transporter [Seiridium cupressi]
MTSQSEAQTLQAEDVQPTSLDHEAETDARDVLPRLLPNDPDAYKALEKKLVRRIDWRLMPVLVVMIVLNYLDRQALPNARVQGIEEDLGLEGDDYNVAISVLFAGYIALQIPSNMLLTRVRPSIYLPVCMTLWGAVSACTAAVKDFRGLVVCRFFLGFLEAPFFPGALFLLSSWYTPKELATRTAVLYTGSLLSGGFGGLVGAGVQYGLDGVHGLYAWQWLFILEGSVTVFLSLLSIFLLPDFPTTTRWLSDQERAIATHRLNKHSGSQDEERGPILHGVKLAVADYKVWLLATIVITKTTAAAVTSFIPTLVATFKFSSVQSLLMVAPPDPFGSWDGGLYHCSIDNGVGAEVFLVVLDARRSVLPRPLEKRAAAFAFTNMVGNFAQIYSPYMYNSSTGPRYLPAMTANTVFVFASICCATVLRFCLVRENRKLDALETDANVENDDPKARDEIVQKGPGGLLVFNPGFRYAL